MTGRVLWIIWCLCWVGFWLSMATLGTMSHGPTGALWIAGIGSAAAIALPVGKVKRERLR